MMKKRFVPPLQNGFGARSTGMVSSATTWISENKLAALALVVAIVALAIGITAYVREDFREKLTELFSSKGKSGALKELDVLFFMSPTCPWCKKMMDVLQNEGTVSEVTIVDVSKPEGREVAKKFGALNRGVPNFVSRKLNAGTIGFKDSTKEIVDALSKVKNPGSTDEPKAPGGHTHPERPEGQQEHGSQEPGQEAVDPQDVASLGIVVLVTEGCPWCKKAKDDAQNLGIMPYLELQDLGTPEGKAFLQQSGIEFKGAPTYFSRATGKTAVGYKPFNQIITALVTE